MPCLWSRQTTVSRRKSSNLLIVSVGGQLGQTLSVRPASPASRYYFTKTRMAHFSGDALVPSNADVFRLKQPDSSRTGVRGTSIRAPQRAHTSAVRSTPLAGDGDVSLRAFKDKPHPRKVIPPNEADDSDEDRCFGCC